MNNSSICTADRATHFKIVLVAFVASVVIAVGIGVSTEGSERGPTQARAAIAKAAKPAVVTAGLVSTLR
jgi:ABC-type proline/glycine betaine transport system permease subunit